MKPNRKFISLWDKLKIRFNVNNSDLDKEIEVEDLLNPLSSIVKTVLYFYSKQGFIYKDINYSLRLKKSVIKFPKY